MTLKNIESKFLIPSEEKIPAGGFRSRLSDDIISGIKEILDDENLGVFFNNLDLNLSNHTIKGMSKIKETSEIPHIEETEKVIKVTYGDKQYNIKIEHIDTKYLPVFLKRYGTGKIEGDVISILSQVPKESRKYAAIHESYDLHMEKIDSTKTPEERMYNAEKLVFKVIKNDYKNDINRPKNKEKYDTGKIVASRLGFFVGAYLANKSYVNSKDITEDQREEITHHNKVVKKFILNKFPQLVQYLATYK